MLGRMLEIAPEAAGEAEQPVAEEQALHALELLEGRVDFLDEIGNAQLVLGRALLEQDRLDEAIKNGASPEEIDQLMKEMQQALNEYMRELAEEAEELRVERDAATGIAFHMWYGRG